MTGQQALLYAIQILQSRLKSFEEPKVTIEHRYPAMEQYNGKSFSITIEADWPERMINNVMLGRFYSDGVAESVEEKENSLSRAGAEAQKAQEGGLVIEEEYNPTLDTGDILDIEGAHKAAERKLGTTIRSGVEEIEVGALGRTEQTGTGESDDEARRKRDEHPQHGAGHSPDEGADR